MKPWQRGYELDHLKFLAGIFSQHMKPHVYGAFGLPKERDMADALVKSELMWTRQFGLAAAIVKVLKSGSTQTDFAQRDIKIQAGDVIVKAIAGDAPSVDHLLSKLQALATDGRAVWLEIFEEMPGMSALAEARGWRYVATKIPASAEVKGVYVLGGRGAAAALPASEMTALKVLRNPFIDADSIAKILEEIDGASSRWEQHYSSYNKRQSWTAFSLCGFDANDPSFIIKPSEMSKGWKEENPDRLAAKCAPTMLASMLQHTMKVVGKIPGEKERVRFMKLRKGDGELTRHADITDRDAGTQDGMIARVHVPIQTAPGCDFFSWSARGEAQKLHFPQGALCYLDIRKPHAVRNDSSIERIHLVVDVKSTPELRELLA